MTQSINLKSLRKRAEAATPKSEYTWEVGHTILGDSGQWAVLRGIPSHSAPLAGHLRLLDTCFISAANPSTVLKLLDVLEIATEALEACTVGDLASGEDIYKAEIAREALARIQEICE